MRYLLAILMACFMMGCSTLSKVVSYAQSNPAIVDLVTTQAVARYIDASVSIEGKRSRANNVIDVVSNLESFMAGNPVANKNTIMAVLMSSIEMEKIPIADRLLIDSIITSVEINLSKQSVNNILPPDAAIRIRVLLRTLTQAAEAYL